MDNRIFRGNTPKQKKKACRMLYSAWTRLNMLAEQFKRGDDEDYKVLWDLTTQFRSYQKQKPHYSVVYPSILRIWSCLEAVWDIRHSKHAQTIRFELLRTAVGAARKAHEHIDPTPFRMRRPTRELRHWYHPESDSFFTTLPGSDSELNHEKWNELDHQEWLKGVAEQNQVREILKNGIPHLIVQLLGSGYAVVQMWLNPDLEDKYGRPFWEPWETGIGRYASRHEAVVEARSWSESDKIPFIDR